MVMLQKNSERRYSVSKSQKHNGYGFFGQNNPFPMLISNIVNVFICFVKSWPWRQYRGALGRSIVCSGKFCKKETPKDFFYRVDKVVNLFWIKKTEQHNFFTSTMSECAICDFWKRGSVTKDAGRCPRHSLQCLYYHFWIQKWFW